MNKSDDSHNLDEKYDDLIDEKAARRDQKKKPKMPMDSAFLRQISKIQEKRFEEKYGSEE